MREWEVGWNVEEPRRRAGQSISFSQISYLFTTHFLGRDMGVDVMILPKLAAEEDPGM